MKRKNLILGCAAAFFTTAAPTLADPSVTATSGQIDNVSVIQSAGSWAISFRAIGTANSSVLVSAASNEPISSIEVETNSNSAYRVNLTVTAPSIASVSKSGGNGEFWVSAITTSTGDIGNVTAAIIGTLDAGDDISGAITSTRNTTGISDDGIASLSADGDITGNITSHRRIGLISAPNGIVGVPGTPPTRIEIEMTSAAGVGEIFAREIHADIDLNAGTGEINYLHTDLPSGGFTGDFVGSLNCSKLGGFGITYGLDVRGDLDAEIDHHTQNMATHFRIGGSLLADILLPTNGLTKQIIINANNSSATWTGAVRLNGSAISHDSAGVYTNPPSDFGGGSVGLATFDFHPQGCVPPHNGVVSDSYFDPTWIGEGDPPCTHNFRGPYIRHFGPVTGHVPNGFSDVYTVQHRVAGTSGSFSNVAWAYATSDAAYNGGVYREQRILRTDGDYVWPDGYEYKITVNQDGSDIAIRCRNDVTGQPYVPTYEYRFTVLDGCASDMDLLFDQDGDDSLTAADLEAWPGDNPDVSGDSQVNSWDAYKLFWGFLQRDNLPR